MPVRLGQEFRPLPPPEPPPEPDALLIAIQELRQHLDILRLPPPNITVSAPPASVLVEPPDLSDIVTAVTSLKPGATAAEIADAIANRLGHLKENGEALTNLAQSVNMAMEKLDFRLRGFGRQAYGGGTVSLAAGTSLEVTGALTDTQLRALPVPVSGTVAVSALTGLVDVTPTVPLATDYLPVRLTDGALFSDAAGTLNNGLETAVSLLAVQVAAANTLRKKLIVQNTGLNNVRIGALGVTVVTGMRLAAGDVIVFRTPHIPTNAIFAIRETLDSTVLTQEVV